MKKNISKLSPVCCNPIEQNKSEHYFTGTTNDLYISELFNLIMSSDNSSMDFEDGRPGCSWKGWSNS